MNQVNSPGYYQANPGSAQGGGTPAAPAVQTQPMMQQNQANAAAARASIESEIINDGLVDPVLKCQELYKHHLLTSLPSLLNQLSIILSPGGDKITSENQFQALGKCVENFNKVCDLMLVNLRSASEAQTISTELKVFTRYLGHMGQLEVNKSDTLYINYVNLQMQRINEVRAILQKYSEAGSSINDQPTPPTTTAQAPAAHTGPTEMVTN